MPTPIGHALAGVAAGCLVGGGRAATLPTVQRGWSTTRKFLTDPRVIAFGVLGALPDIDFLFGVHSAYTHSVGAIAVVGVVGGFAGSRVELRSGAAAAAAYGSHVALDWLGSDAVAPIGIMALWPLSSEFFLSDRYWFMSVCREYWRAECWWHNALAVIHELFVLGSIAVGSIVVRRRLNR